MPDINDLGEIVYDFPHLGSSQHQIFSTVRGQLTSSSNYHRADIARINNNGEVVFRGHTTEGGNGLIYRLDGSRVDLGPDFIAANDVDINDFGEVVGIGLTPATQPVVESLNSSTRGLLLETVQSFGSRATLLNNGQVVSNTGVAITPNFDYRSIPGLPQGHGLVFSVNDQGDVAYSTQNQELFMWDGTQHYLVYVSPTIMGGPRMNNNREIVFLEVRDGINQIMLASPAETITIVLDVKPGSDSNPVNITSNGVLPVSVVSTDLFNAADVDVDTLLFGDPVLIDVGGMGVSPFRSVLEDVTSDGLLDLSLQFSIPQMIDGGILGPLSEQLRLTGSTLDGKLLVGVDNISVRPNPEPATWLLALIACFAAPWRRNATGA